MDGSTATVSGMEYGDMHVLYLLCDYVFIGEGKSSSMAVYITFHLL